MLTKKERKNIKSIIMGNLISNNLITDSIITLMQKQSNKPAQTSNHATRPVLQPKTKPDNSRNTSIPKNVKKDPVPKLKQANPKQGVAIHQIPSFSTHDILAKVLKITIEETEFDKSWKRFQQAVGKCFTFKLIFPDQINSHGTELMKQGAFIVYWLKIVSKNPFINMQILGKNVREQFLPAVEKQKSYLQSYLNQISPVIHQQTPKKEPHNQQSLKRSILKNSSKKVQFGENEIIYPVLESYISEAMNLHIPSKQQKKQNIRKKRGFILDYFEINDVFLLEEVEIVGVLKQYDQTHAIIQVKQRQSGTQWTCIGIITENFEQGHSLKTLQAIQKQFQNLAYLQLQGKKTGQIWIDSLPSQRPV